MSSFSTANAARQPFGKNQYLRSTKRKGTMSYTFSKLGIPTITVDGDVTKVLQPGTVVAKITSGPEAGKIGVFQAVGTDEVQRLTKAGTVSGGTFTLTVLGATTAAIAFDANAATIQAAIRLAIATAYTNGTVSADVAAIGDGITVAGGPFSGATPVDVTFNGEVGADVAQITADTALLTGAGAGITPSTTTPGVAGATDGRGVTANIVGVVDTFLPWQLTERDVEVSVVYDAALVQEWCIEYNAAGEPVALGNTTRDAIIARTDLSLMFPDPA